MRVLVIHTHAVPYFVPSIRLLAREPGVEVRVLYGSKLGIDDTVDPTYGHAVQWKVPVLEGYDARFLERSGTRRPLDGFWSVWNPGFADAIDAFAPDVVWLQTYVYATPFFAHAYCRARRIPMVYRCESSLEHDRRIPPPFAKRAAKRAWLRTWLSGFDAFLAVGSRNRAFYRAYGVPDERVFSSPYSVDNDFFRDGASMTDDERAALRRAHDIAPDATVFVFPARLVPFKRPEVVLDALGRMRGPRAAQSHLVFAGDGEMEASLRDKTRALGLESRVRFLGFVDQADLPRIYGMSDVLVRADRITKGDWGLTVNEGCAAGLAIIGTDTVGACDDLLFEGDNGRYYRPGDPTSLAAVMDDLSADPARLRAMGRRSLEIVARWGPAETAKGALAGLRYAVAQRRRS